MHNERFVAGRITSGLQRGLKNGVGALMRSVTTLKEKTGEMGRKSMQRLSVLGRRSKNSIKKIFRRAA